MEKEKNRKWTKDIKQKAEEEKNKEEEREEGKQKKSILHIILT